MPADVFRFFSRSNLSWYACQGEITRDREGDPSVPDAKPDPSAWEEFEGLKNALAVKVQTKGNGGNRHEPLYMRQPQDDQYLVFGPQDLLPIRIRVLRARHGWSQAAIAERLGISQEAYPKLERTSSNFR